MVMHATQAYPVSPRIVHARRDHPRRGFRILAALSAALALGAGAVHISQRADRPAGSVALDATYLTPSGFFLRYSPAWAVRAVFVGSVDEMRMVKARLAPPQHDRHRRELRPLLLAQHLLDGVHVVGEPRDR